MTERRTSDTEITINSIREAMGADGHLVENVASFIVMSISSMRIPVMDDQAPYAKLIDAISSMQNEDSQDTVHRLIVFEDVLGQAFKDVAISAKLAGILTSEKERIELHEASDNGIEELRASALRLKTFDKLGQLTTLGEVINKTHRTKLN